MDKETNLHRGESYVNLLEPRGNPVKGRIKNVSRGVITLIVAALIVCVLLIFLCPRKGNGESLWSPEQERMIRVFCDIFKTPSAKEVGIDSAIIFFRTKNRNQKLGASITFENGSFEVMKVIENVAPPEKQKEARAIG
jgi:hypothetical protein